MWTHFILQFNIQQRVIFNICNTYICFPKILNFGDFLGSQGRKAVLSQLERILFKYSLINTDVTGQLGKLP